MNDTTKNSCAVRCRSCYRDGEQTLAAVRNDVLRRQADLLPPPRAASTQRGSTPTCRVLHSHLGGGRGRFVEPKHRRVKRTCQLLDHPRGMNEAQEA